MLPECLALAVFWGGSPPGHMAKTYLSACMSGSGRTVYSVSFYNRWLRDNPGKATAKWRRRDGQRKGEEGDGVAFAWMPRANSGLLIPVPYALPLFLLVTLQLH